MVVPLETEIKSLKGQLETVQSKLVSSENKLANYMKNDCKGQEAEHGRASPSLPDLDSITDLNEKVTVQNLNFFH